MRPALLLLCLLCAAPTRFPAPIATTPATPASERRDDRAPLTIEQAVERVRQRFDARVVRADEVQDGADVYYRIRLLAADGRVFTVRVNARSGAID